MTTYVDSSALVPIYVPERFSTAAHSAIRTAGQVPFTAIHELEVPNAFELLVGRALMTRGECREVQRQLRDDLASRRSSSRWTDRSSSSSRAAATRC